MTTNVMFLTNKVYSAINTCVNVENLYLKHRDHLNNLPMCRKSYSCIPLCVLHFQPLPGSFMDYKVPPLSLALNEHS